VTRKKTNVKNTTWEETEPVLQNYFRAFRRRLRDANWWDTRRSVRQAVVTAARESAATTARTPLASAAAPPHRPTEAVEADGEEGRAHARAAWDAAPPASPPQQQADMDQQQQASPVEPRRSPRNHAPPSPPPPPPPTQQQQGNMEHQQGLPVEPRRSPRKRARDEESDAAAQEPDVPWFKRGRGRWGAYLPHQRGNVDQVPLPFICDMDYTLEEKGAQRVAINQLGPSLSKRQATAQVCLRPEPPPPPPPDASPAVKKKYKENLMEQPPPCLIFRGTGARISQEELDAYPPELVVLWQPKAWVDRPIAVAWAKKCWRKMIAADKAAGVADESSRYLLIEDNLDAQDALRNPPYIDALLEDQTDDHKVPKGKTDQVQPIDDGAGRLYKQYVGQEEDAWLEDDENLRKWENDELTASDRRILLAQWYVAAHKRIVKLHSTLRKWFEHTCALLTADGTEDDLIKLEGMPKGHVFSWVDDEVPQEFAAPPPTVSDDPPDECPLREDEQGLGGADERDYLDDDSDDDIDEDDAPPAPKEAPTGFTILAEAPPFLADKLVFSKGSSPADELVGRSILYNWPAVGWWVHRAQ